MSVAQFPNSLYGFPGPLTTTTQPPIISLRTPTTSDFAALGTLWIYKTGNAAYVITSIVSNAATWNLLEASGGAGAFTTLTSSGNTNLATGTGSTFTAGNTTGNISIGAANTTATTTIGNTTSTSTLNLNAGSGGINLTGATAITGATTIVGTTNINVSGAAGTNIGYGGTGAVNIGNTTGNTIVTGSLIATGEIGGLSVAATGDIGAGVVANTILTNATVAVAGGTGVFVINPSSGAGNTANTGFIKLYAGTQAIYIPYWIATT